MRFMLWIATDQPWQDVRAAADAAEQSGWDGIYLADHFMPNEQPPGLTPRLEAWTALAGLAVLTERLRLGVLVSGNTYRHPAVLAKMAATADLLSGGRLVLGLGAGWQVSEHVAYGIDLPEIPERLARLEEGCQVVKLLFSNERSDFEGRYYQLVDAPCEPKPLQPDLPLLLGVSGERISMGIAARQADIWNCWGTPDTIRHKLEVLDRHCEEQGRDPATLERSAQALVMMSDDPARLKAWQTGPPVMPALIGTPAQLGAELATYRDMGLDEFVVSDRPFGAEVPERLDGLRRFWAEVAGPLRA